MWQGCARARALLTEEGFIQGTNYSLAVRSAEGDFSRYAQLVMELGVLSMSWLASRVSANCYAGFDASFFWGLKALLRATIPAFAAREQRRQRIAAIMHGEFVAKDATGHHSRVMHRALVAFR